MQVRSGAAAILLGLCLAGSAWAGEDAASTPGSADKAAVRHVIEGQIEAFRHGDAPAALAFAAPGVQAKFATPAAFLDMVREAYSPVVRPRSFSFGAIMPHAGLLLQKVELVGADGSAALAIYEMEHEADGTWRVAGCSLGESEAVQL